MIDSFRIALIPQVNKDFAGIKIDSFLTTDSLAYATLTSIGKGLEIDRKNVQNWLERHNQTTHGLAVTVGIYNKAATAHPVDVIGDFLDYRVFLGDKRVLALYSATFRADLLA